MKKIIGLTKLCINALAVVFVFSFVSVLNADTFIVTTTSDNGAGSFRQALLDANSNTGADTIIFNIPDTDVGYDAVKGVWTIQPQSGLPFLSDDSTFINGATQSAFIGGDLNIYGPEIVINGSNAGSATGIALDSSHNAVNSITINGFSQSGISVYGHSNKIFGCFLGPDYKGDGRIPGQDYGIFIGMSAENNIIGGTAEGERNVISGNTLTGIIFTGSSHDNQVSGNYIGLKSTGADTLGNLYCGIELSFKAKNNILGPANIVSGNKGHGITIIGSGTESNYVIGNYIGTDATGTVSFGNRNSGVWIGNKAKYNEIGGLAIVERNIISGNTENGVEVWGDSTSFNVVKGNYIGLSAAGDSLGNKSSGISIMSHASSNIIGPGNVISSNKSDGISLSYGSPGKNTIKGNLIGTDTLGSYKRGNEGCGITISSGKGNIIGGSLPEDKNVISGNKKSGIFIYSFSNESDSTSVIGNYIGTDILGTDTLGNNSDGIHISGTIQNISCSFNVVSGNAYSGVLMSGSVSNSLISNNKIGVDAAGTGELGNQQYGIQLSSDCSNNEIGPGNVVAYNKYNGIYIGGNSVQNRITENSIFNNGWKGIDNVNGGNTELPTPVITKFGSVIGTAPSNSAVEIFSGIDKFGGQNFEGSVLTDGAGNFVWNGDAKGPWVTATATDADGNTSEFSAAKYFGNIVVTTTSDTGEGSLRNAIDLSNSSAGPDTIAFNIPNTDPGFNGTVWVISPLEELPALSDSFTAIIGETQTEFGSDTNPDGPEIMIYGRNMTSYGSGIQIYSSNNTVSGLIISAFKSNGIGMAGVQCKNNRIINNYIGTNAAGNDTLGNGTGLNINGGGGNYIGETGENGGNVISGNKNRGIYMTYSHNNYIMDNIIGLNADGDKTVPNRSEGIYMYESSRNIIGSMDDGKNVISGNYYNGVIISGENAIENHIVNNYIGTDLSGAKALGNLYTGISIYNKAKHNVFGPGNIVSGNHSNGITISGAGTDSNYVYGNWIGLDATGQDTIPNYNHGVRIVYNAKYNIIGGPEEQERNIISGNGWSGIGTAHDSTAFNVFRNNYLGTDVSGTKDLGNVFYGIHFGGLSNLCEDNLISGNEIGIKLAYSIGGNIIRNNMIGVQADGISPLPNDEYGIESDASVCCDTVGPSNKIWYNKLYGIKLAGTDVKKVRITENSISNNGIGGITIESGANQDITAPVITNKDPVTGTAAPNNIIEVFSDSLDQGRIFEGKTTADGSGKWTYSGSVLGPYVTATATDDSGNTSAFSNYLKVFVKEITFEDRVPSKFFLNQNYPNPFNPETTICFGVKEGSRVTLNIYNSLGQKVATLIDKNYQPGVYRVKADMSGFASGIYIYQINMKGFSSSIKMILME